MIFVGKSSVIVGSSIIVGNVVVVLVTKSASSGWFCRGVA